MKRVDLGDGNYDWSILNQTSTADYLKTELRSHLWKQLESLKLIVSESEANKPTKDQVMEDLSKVNLGKPANMDVRIKAAWLTQPSLAQGTGCLIGPDRILTCAHMDVTEDGTKSEDETFIEHPEQFVALLGYRAANFPGGKLAALDPWRVREIERCVPYVGPTTNFLTFAASSCFPGGAMTSSGAASGPTLAST